MSRQVHQFKTKFISILSSYYRLNRYKSYIGNRSRGKANNSIITKYHLYTGERLNWLQVIIRLQRSLIKVLLPWVVFLGIYGFIISLLYYFGISLIVPDESGFITKAVLSFNIGLTLLLVFRTNTAHERFWEGRKLWGSLVNVVRNLARDIWIVVKEQKSSDRVEKEATLRLIVAFAIAMKLHLRREPVNKDLASLMSEARYEMLKNTQHPPLQIAFWIGDYLQEQHDRDRLNIYQLAALHKLVDNLVDILGGCERILKTPLPLIYTIILKELVLFYCLILPLEIVKDLTWGTGIITALVGFTLLAIEEIGHEIEEPFGHDPNDLPLDAICKTMQGNVEELIEMAGRKSHSCQP